jgi:hypothetical protein
MYCCVFQCLVDLRACRPTDRSGEGIEEWVLWDAKCRALGPDLGNRRVGPCDVSVSRCG